MKYPDGFFMFGALFWGDSLSKDTVISKGFYLELPDMASASVDALHRLQSQIRSFLYSIEEGWSAQVNWSVDSDYRTPLEAYAKVTEEGEMSEFSRYHRRMVHGELYAKMVRGELRRERLAVFIGKKCNTVPKSIRSNAEAIEKVIKSHVHALEERIASLTAVFGDAKIIPMDDQENYYWMRRFWNPSLSLLAHDPARRYEGFRSNDQISQCIRGDGVPVKLDEEGVCMRMDDHFHSVFVLKRWPQQSWPGIMRVVTQAAGLDYTIVQSVFPLSVQGEIGKAEKKLIRLQGDAESENKQSLRTDVEKLAVKIDKLAQGYTRPYEVVTIIRVWDRTIGGLVAKNAAIKAAVQGMSGAQVHQCNQPIQFSELLCASVPGWLGSRLQRDWGMYATSDYLPDLLPMSNTFTGHIDKAEALYEGNQGQVVGVRFFSGGTPQHALWTGMTGAGKSVAVIDMLTQTEPGYVFTAIIEEGLSYAVYTRTLGGEPIIIRPDGELTINYFDTEGLPLTAGHIATASSLCLKMIGTDPSAENNNRRAAMLAEYVHALYREGVEEFLKDQPESLREDITREALVVERFQRDRMARGSTFLDAYLELRELKKADPRESERIFAAVSDQDILRAQKTPEQWKMAEAVCIGRFSHEDFKRCGIVHAALVEVLRFTPLNFHDVKETKYLGTMLNAWTAAEGKYGKLFDGVTNINLRGRVAHFELGEIPESSKELKEAAGFLISEYVRQHIVTLPRGVRKRIIFEEMGRFLDVPEGAKIVSEAYAQLRKYGCLVLSVTQVFSQLKKTPLFPVIRGNSKVFALMRQQDHTEVEDLGDAIGLPGLARQPIKDYPLPEHQAPGARFSSYTYYAPEGASSVCGTVIVKATREMLYVASSNGSLFDRRMKALAAYPDVLEGILAESDREFGRS